MVSEEEILAAFDLYLTEEKLELYDLNIANYPAISRVEVFIVSDYEIDVAPYTGYVMVVDVMDYGAEFSSGSIVSAGEVIHPTTPNRRVYVAQNSGQLGVTEPEWIESGSVVSGEVVFLAKPLYQPQAGGYLKPLIEPK